MKATLQDLRGKYYGTIVEIEFDGYKTEVKLWDSGDFTPSERYLNEFGFTREQWDKNEVIDSEWGSEPIRSLDLVVDSHFESDITYKRAIALINKINS